MSENKDAHLKELIDKYARLYMEMACNNGIPSEYAEDIVVEAFWSYYSSDSFGCLSEAEAKIVIAHIVKIVCRDFAEQKSERKEADWADTGMGCYY